MAHEYRVDDRVYLLFPGWFNTQNIPYGIASEIPNPPDLSTNPVLSGYSKKLSQFAEKIKKSNKHSESPEDSEKFSTKRREVKRREDKEPPVPLCDFGDLEPEVVAYLAAASAENKTGKISPGRELTLRRELALAREELPAAFAAGLRAAVKAGAPNVNYVRRAAESMSRRADSPMRAAVDSSRPAPRLTHGYGMDGTLIECADGQEPNGWSNIPPRTLRLKMAQLWPEDKHMGVDFEPPVPPGLAILRTGVSA
jgi:hypothetical protein